MNPETPDLARLLAGVKPIIARVGDHDIPDALVLRRLEQALAKGWSVGRDGVIEPGPFALRLLAYLDLLVEDATGRRFHDPERQSEDAGVVMGALAQMMHVRATYDPRADAAYVYVRSAGERPWARTEIAEDGTILDYDARDQLLGYELLSVRHHGLDAYRSVPEAMRKLVARAMQAASERMVWIVEDGP